MQLLLQGRRPSASLKDGDTVTVEGVLTVAPVVDAQFDRRPIVWAGSRWVTYMQDIDGQPWGGMNILQDDTTGDNQNTFFDLADTAQVIRITGVVTEYYTSTEMLLLLDPIRPVEVIDQLEKRPDPIELTMDDMMVDGVKNLEGEKYEAMYCELYNLFVSDVVTSGSGAGNFKLNDGSGNFIQVYAQSGYFKGSGATGSLSDITDYNMPAEGTELESIRGIITTRDDTYYIVPLYPGDIKLGAVAPPNIADVTRDKPKYTNREDIVISSKIVDSDGSIELAQLNYRINGGKLNTVNMTESTTSVYSVTIPAISEDSALVDYYIVAKDNAGKYAYSPVDTVTDKYFFFVLNRDIKISDVQYSPFGSGYSSFNN